MENQLIKFNVGGKLFTTTKSTLNRYPKSRLAKLCEDNNLNSYMDENGYIFVDRNGDYFGSILNFYKTNQIKLNNKMTLTGLHEEAKFYLLDDLVNYCENQINLKKIKLDVRGTVFEVSFNRLTKSSNYFKEAFDNIDVVDSFKNENGCIYIDRDPNLFAILYEYLQNESMDSIIRKYEQGQLISLDVLIKEAKYFKMDSLLLEIKSCYEHFKN